jgi:poly(hydroxyalkanoate) depolymerase family esterase
MIDTMNDITEFSPFGGRLVSEEVKGTIADQKVPENSVKTNQGCDRDMFVYVPASGCPDAKQAQVVMVLRDGLDEQSAADLMKAYRLDDLAEKKHFILVFPNMGVEGWNYASDPNREDDVDYLIRCFAALPVSKGHVAGFNGMIFYIAASKAASAMLMTLAMRSPIDAAGVMISGFPENYGIPSDVPGFPQAAYICGDNTLAEDYFMQANAVAEADRTELGHVSVYTNPVNPNVRHMHSPHEISAEEIAFAWDALFSETRRWRNDTYGTYQERTNFTDRGFIAHVNDTCLGVNNGFAHTWYEYVPPKLRGTSKKVPLLFYFHGIGCVPLYGAEQSGWHDIADRENFIVVYPKPAIEKRWNVWDDPALPSDMEFVMALLDRMKRLYAIDETRIYLSGFSMGSMMTNALACSYPELFAAAAPCNGPHLGYLSSLKGFAPMLMKMNPKSVLKTMIDQLSDSDSPTKVLADRKKAQKDYRMPLIQNSGLLDGQWPIAKADDLWIRTFDYWKSYNNIPTEPYTVNPGFESGLTSEETFYEGDDSRFLHHKWLSGDEGHPSLYEVVLAKRMPHALDLRQLGIAWEFMKKFSRNPDGSLKIHESAPV